ncbi:MAG TPA: putative baseplate assembly protein [Pyrinomonadaceae bacterium]|nr:putative baseplate assembly protein [Pyrinomonadaceae bacterium]
MSTTCKCCEGTHKLTPSPTENRPGLDALSYRVGTHATFFETMRARLSNMAVDTVEGGKTETTYPLGALTTRDSRDFAVAVLDGWATVGDVLTFYQERIANEGYLRTATERRSVLELARLVGYALKPGVSSTVYLAYTIDENFKETALVEVGARAQSVPGPGELPQSFETSEPLEARAQWNKLKPRATQPQTLKSIERRGGIYLKGINTNLKPNDPLLVTNGSDSVLARVLEVLPDALADRTFVKAAGWNDAPRVTGGRSDFNADATERAQYLAAARTVVQHYSDTEQFKVNPNTKTAGRVLKVLQDLQAGLSDDMKISDLDKLVKEKTELLEDEHAAAVLQNFTVLKPWIAGAIDDLKTITSAIDSHEDPADDAAKGGALDPARSSADYNTGRGFGDIMVALAAPPSVQPANSLQLGRRLDKSFARGSDTGLQFVGAVRPEIREALPNALASVRATRESEIEVYALRAKAATYGSTAPKKNVLDANGAVVATQEWPINGTQTVSVSLDLTQGGNQTRPFNVNLSLTQGALLFTAKSALNENAATSVKVGDLNVNFGTGKSFHEAGGFVVTIGAATFVFKHVDDENLLVTIKTNNANDLAERNLGLEQSVSLFASGRNVLVRHFMRRVEERVILITQETPLPPQPQDVIALDATYDQITPGGWVAVVRGVTGDPVIARAVTTQTVAKNDYNFPAKVTQLRLSANWLTNQDLLLSDIRDTTVYAQSERLEMAGEPVETPVCGDGGGWLELDGLYSDLKSGRWLIVAGERADVQDASGKTLDGVRAAELVMLSDVRQDVASPAKPRPAPPPPPPTDGQTVGVTTTNTATETSGKNGEQQRAEERGLPGDSIHTFIKFASKLAYCYKRDKVTIYGNVAKATHGETRDETLGAGDASRPLQSFTLRQPPLTYVSAPTTDGTESTLRAYVNNIEWHETDAFVGLGANDRAFVTRTDDEGKTTLTFGNGKEGARLPTGLENVRAVYRSGIGKPGNVRADQISLLVTRPLGVKDVINPLRASGGADKESRDQARRHAPLAVAALDRLVSVQDYADFTRTFAGIGKATAARLSDGRRTLVHLTIAGEEDIPIDTNSDLYHNLLRALREFGSPEIPVRVAMRELLLLVVSAKVNVVADYLWEPVATEIRRTMLDTFSFDRRDLGQDVLLSEVISTIQSVEGVNYVDVDVLGVVPEKKLDAPGGVSRLLTPNEITATVQKILADAAQPTQRVRVAESAGGSLNIQAAQLAVLSPDVPDTFILNQIK